MSAARKLPTEMQRQSARRLARKTNFTKDISAHAIAVRKAAGFSRAQPHQGEDDDAAEFTLGPSAFKKRRGLMAERRALLARSVDLRETEKAERLQRDCDVEHS